MCCLRCLLYYSFSNPMRTIQPKNIPLHPQRITRSIISFPGDNSYELFFGVEYPHPIRLRDWRGNRFQARVCIHRGSLLGRWLFSRIRGSIPISVWKGLVWIVWRGLNVATGGDTGGTMVKARIWIRKKVGSRLMKSMTSWRRGICVLSRICGISFRRRRALLA